MNLISTFSLNFDNLIQLVGNQKHIGNHFCGIDFGNIIHGNDLQSKEG